VELPMDVTGSRTGGAQYE